MIDIPEKLTGKKRAFHEGSILGTFSALLLLTALRFFPKSSKFVIGAAMAASYLTINNFYASPEQNSLFKLHLKPNLKALPSYTGYVIGFLGILGLSSLSFFNGLKPILNYPKVVFPLALINKFEAIRHAISTKQEIYQDINPVVPSTTLDTTTLDTNLIPREYHPIDPKEPIIDSRLIGSHRFSNEIQEEHERTYKSGRKEKYFVSVPDHS